MIDLRPDDLLHKSYLNRLLMEVVDRPILAHNLAFKGGTCAALLGYLDRFSVDLDFDLVNGLDEDELRGEFIRVFDHQGLKVVREISNALFFQLRYPNEPGKRNSLRISASGTRIKANQYKVQYFPEIDRLINSQTLETMVANKLVAVTDRFSQHAAIAGRDIYDVHYFLVHGYGFHAPVIQERTGVDAIQYLATLIQFIKANVTQKIIDEDLNTLLTPIQFQRMRKILLPETLALLSAAKNSLESK